MQTTLCNQASPFLLTSRCLIISFALNEQLSTNSASPTQLLTQGQLEQVSQGNIQSGFESLQG